MLHTHVPATSLVIVYILIRFRPSSLMRYDCVFVLIHFQERVQINAFLFMHCIFRCVQSFRPHKYAESFHRKRIVKKARRPSQSTLALSEQVKWCHAQRVSVLRQEPITRSEQLPYQAYVTAFLRTSLFLGTFQGTFSRKNKIWVHSKYKISKRKTKRY